MDIALRNLPVSRRITALANLTGEQRAQQHAPRVHKVSDQDECYRFTNATDDAPARLDLFDEIGFWGKTASEFNAELQAVKGDRLAVHINSGGGDVFDGLAMMNLLRAHPAAVDVIVDGLAASAASYIAMGGDTLTMMPNSEMMIHDASGFCMGNPADMQAMSELLDHISDNIASVYANRAGGTVAEWRAVMAGEGWYTANEAVTAGLADKVGPTRGTTAETTETEPAATDAATTRPANLSFYNYSGRLAAPAPVSPVAVTSPAAPVTPAPVVTDIATEPVVLTAQPTAATLDPVQILAALRGAFSSTVKEAR